MSMWLKYGKWMCRKFRCTHIFMSPDPVIIVLSSRKRHEDRKPSYPRSSRTIFAAPVESRLFRSYMVHMLSIPPHAVADISMRGCCGIGQVTVELFAVWLTDIVSRWCKGHAHDPGWSQWDDLHLVTRPCVPDDEFAVQWSCHCVPVVSICS